MSEKPYMHPDYLEEIGRNYPTAHTLIVWQAAEIERLRAALHEKPTKLWLWRNGDHFLAFDNPCPTYGGGDPMTLGKPVGVAILTPSTPGWERWDEEGKPIPSANRA